MSRNFSTLLKKQLFAQEMDGVAIVLVSITHPEFEIDYHVSSNNDAMLSNGFRGTLSNGVEYTQYPFDVTMQEQSDNLAARAKIAIDNVSRELLLAIEQIQNNEPPTVRIQVVLDKEPDVIIADARKLQMHNIDATAFVIEAELLPRLMQGKKYPKYSFNPADWPAVHGR